MTGIMTLITAIASGLVAVFNYGNIAVSVLFLCLCLSVTLNYIFIRNLLKMAGVLNSVSSAINALNDRIKHD